MLNPGWQDIFQQILTNFASKKLTRISTHILPGPHDTHHNDNNHNGIQHNDTYNDTQHNGTPYSLLLLSLSFMLSVESKQLRLCVVMLSVVVLSVWHHCQTFRLISF